MMKKTIGLILFLGQIQTIGSIVNQWTHFLQRISFGQIQNLQYFYNSNKTRDLKFSKFSILFATTRNKNGVLRIIHGLVTESVEIVLTQQKIEIFCTEKSQSNFYFNAFTSIHYPNKV